MTTLPPTRRIPVRVLTEDDRESLLGLLEQDRLGTLYLRSLVHEYGVTPTPVMEHGRFYGSPEGTSLAAVLFHGNSRSLCSAGDERALTPILDHAVSDRRNPRLYVGPVSHAQLVRRAFARTGASPFLDREQTYYILTPDRLASLESLDIRPAVPRDLKAVTAAQAAMTEEDLEIPRRQIDMERLRQISIRRIQAGKVWVIEEKGRLVFKTEEVARSPEGILVGGVYTEPEYRGRGLATRGMAAWARRLFDEGLSVLALHVNAKNRAAVKAYERAGFARHGTLRLMLTA